MKAKDLIEEHEEFLGYVMRTAKMRGWLIAKYASQIDAFHDLFPEIKLEVAQYSICLNRPKRNEMLAFLQCFSGNWEKNISEYNKTKMDYIQNIDGYTLKVTYCEPPPNCQLIEEEVIIPAQAERIEKRMVVKCTKQENIEAAQ